MGGKVTFLPPMDAGTVVGLCAYVATVRNMSTKDGGFDEIADSISAKLPDVPPQMITRALGRAGEWVDFAVAVIERSGLLAAEIQSEKLKGLGKGESARTTALNDHDNGRQQLAWEAAMAALSDAAGSLPAGHEVHTALLAHGMEQWIASYVVGFYTVAVVEAKTRVADRAAAN